jgi:hypothetical protein
MKGMLERNELLMRPGNGSGTQTIVDPQTGTVLGLARWFVPEDHRWWRWLRATHLSVHEAEDEPLVFTVRRSWGLRQRAEVCDADDHPVGSLRGTAVQGRDGRTVALMEPAAGGGLFRAGSGEELARWTAGPEGARLIFCPELSDPFLKMLLLAAWINRAQS